LETHVGRKSLGHQIDGIINHYTLNAICADAVDARR
jgi:hypothetical protein